MSDYEVYKKYDSAFSYIKAERKIMYWTWFIINAVMPILLILAYSTFAKVEINELQMLFYIAPIILFIFIMFKMYLSAIYPAYLFKSPELEGIGPNHQKTNRKTTTSTDSTSAAAIHTSDTGSSCGGDSGGGGGGDGGC